ncbi:MAG: DEAD/DEAH box helicase [Spirochaetales bacterium]|nr:DEAD/DEAH box helicase [Spirochaetales bacterium]
MKQHLSLALFHPLIARWFEEKFTTPTDIQEKAWPVIARGDHVLVTAPTGSGKTLTAFLWALNSLISGRWTGENVHVLYISPLRALNVDVQRNLTAPLAEIERVFRERGEYFPRIRVLTRSGDTPQSDRRRMITHPPEILITTPESLNLMISSPRARGLFTSIKTVIMDEIHSIARAKRGTHMITAVDRLVRLGGEFQRVAISATVKPLEVIADFVAGYRMAGHGNMVNYIKRQVTLLQSEKVKPVSIDVEFPENARTSIVDATWWPVLVKSFKQKIARNRATLLFTNTRKLSEKVTSLINEDEPELIAYAHHGSLSKEIRTLVEQKLKKGELKAIVATSSLELGIDIGNLDEVICIESPPAVSSGLQRIGRAGHRVDEEIRGIIFPTHGRDFLLSAVVARCIAEKDIEDTVPVICPLDVLAQLIISMTCMEKWNPTELFEFLRTSYPYHTLTRRQFDITVTMLTGKYSESRIRELKPRIEFDRIENTLKGKKESLSLLYLSGGTIPDRGYFDLKVSGSDTRIGNLDEEFVWERRVGHVFSLGTQAWKIVSIDHQKVEVIPWDNRTNAIPFWKADRRSADFHLMDKTGLFLEKWYNDLENPELLHILKKEYCMKQPAAEELVSFLKLQKEISGADLPHRHHILIEHVDEGTENTEVNRIIIHTLWGGKLNYPYSLAISSAWEDRYHYPLEVFSDDFCIMILLPHEFDSRTLLELVHPDSIESHLRKKLETTGFFGALFRENAGRALLLPKMNFGKRLPLWLTRLRAKKLYDAVLRYTDFPILLETWRSCMIDEFNLSQLKKLLAELDNNEIRITEAHTSQVSPFASGLVWRQMDKHMYEDDAPSSGRISRLADDILKEVIAESRLRPQIKKYVIADFEKKIQRREPGYAPGTTEDLLEWIKERIILPLDEWQELLSGYEGSSGPGEKPDWEILSAKAVKIRLPGSSSEVITAIETLPRLSAVLSLGLSDISIQPPGEESIKEKALISQLENRIKRFCREYTDSQTDILLFDDLFAEWCRFYGPLSFHFIEQVFGIEQAKIRQVCTRLAERGDIIIDEVTEGASVTEICDAENFERLLRLARKKARPVFKPLPLFHLPLFLAAWQGITSPGIGIESVKKVLEQNFGYTAQSGLWENEFFPLRVKDYSPSFLDTLLTQTNLLWFGCKKTYLGFSLLEDSDLFFEHAEENKERKSDNFFPSVSDTSPADMKAGKYSFWEILDHTRMTTSELTQAIWEAVWQGEISNESYDVIRRGIRVRFRPGSTVPDYSRNPNIRRSRRVGYDRWKTSRPSQGAWFRLPVFSYTDDRLLYEEIKKERVRQLFLRYGILFRDILAHELPSLQWRELFRTLYLMELSGEVTSGYFFEGIRGPQFISKDAYRQLCSGLDESQIFWINSTDPVYPYDALKTYDRSLPYRHPSTHIVFHGSIPVLISRKKCKEIELRVGPDNPDIRLYAGFFHFLTNRKTNPYNAVRIERINDLPVSKSPYCDPLIKAGFQKDYNRLILRGGY